MMLDDPRWQKLWLQYCRMYSAPKEVVIRDMTTGTEGNDAAYVRDGRLAAYVYHQTKNEAFLKAGIESLIRTGRGERARPIRHITGSEVLNPVDEGPGNTNSASQNGLETIAMLGLIGDHLPAEFPPKSETPDEPRDAPRRAPPKLAPAGTPKT